jgi:predicted membrane channel-forming protein YqfA (hemolysin III family)
VRVLTHGFARYHFIAHKTNFTVPLVNIYTHLFGGLLFAGLPFYIYSTVYRDGQLGDIVVFTTFFVGVAVCFIFSAWYEISIAFFSSLTVLPL